LRNRKKTSLKHLVFVVAHVFTSTINANKKPALKPRPTNRSNNEPQTKSKQNKRLSDQQLQREANIAQHIAIGQRVGVKGRGDRVVVRFVGQTQVRI
jgi:hypothetical protein